MTFLQTLAIGLTLLKTREPNRGIMCLKAFGAKHET